MPAEIAVDESFPAALAATTALDPGSAAAAEISAAAAADGCGGHAPPAAAGKGGGGGRLLAAALGICWRDTERKQRRRELQFVSRMQCLYECYLTKKR